MERIATESSGPAETGATSPWARLRGGLHVLLAIVLAGALAAGCGGEVDDDTGAGSASGAAPMARSLGLSYMRSGELEGAAEQFRRYIDAAPDAPFGYTNLGLVRLWQGRAGEAERHVRRALKIAPGDADVRLNLAAVLVATGRTDSARAVLRGTLSERPEHPRTLYALAEIYGEEDGRRARERRADLLRRLVEAGPANLAARTAMAETAARLGDAATAAEHLAAIRRQAPRLPDEVARRLDRAIRVLETESPGDALPPVTAFADRFELTTTYQTAAAELRGPRRDLPGAVTVDFTRTGTPGAGEEGPAVVLRPAEGEVLPDGGGATVALDAGDYDGDGDVDLAVGGPSRGLRLLRNDAGRFVDATDSAGVAASYDDAAGTDGPGPTAVAFADVDNDGWLDLYVARAGRNLLFLNRGDGTFRESAASSGVTGPGGAGASEVLFVDLEHDGDLDLLLVGPFGQRAYRNDGAGSFTERTGEFGFGRETAGTSAAFADFGDDVDLDVVVARRDGPPLLYENRRGGRFREASARHGLDGAGPAGDVDVGDWDGDGDFDLVLGPGGARSVRLVENRGEEGFAPPEAGGLPASRSGGGAGPVRLVDLDNDGDLDLLVGGAGSGGLSVYVKRGGDGYRAAPEWTPEASGGIRAIASLDYDGDADLDVAAGGGDGLRILRNDGGSSNHQMMVRLTGLRAGGGKNNHFGVGARVEVRAGESYQVRMVTGPTAVHFGLGDRPRAEVARVQWPNGVPQTVYYASSSGAGVAEEQTLKGSCVFLYTWDGDGYTFVTDVLWRSALGMPVGIMGGSGSRGRRYAPAAPSREYRRIPGEALRPRDGRYLLQLTEELWETAYVDEVRLVAVDHPDSVRVFLDERFVPAGAERGRLGERFHPVTDVRPPAGARDDEGRDLLPKLRRQDDVYAAPFSPGPHQGVVSPHSIVLDAGDLASRRRPVLLLTGWVYPTDASINVAMAQNDGLSSRPPVLQVPDGEGGWRTVGEIGFPAGKAKTLVADLRPVAEAGADSVRIRTNMQVYWDRIAVASRMPEATVRRSTLRPDSAHLHFRGYSREYRRGGRNGPFWFDYDDVSRVSRWRPTAGRYTRYGDVRELLTGADDKYAIMAQGDELTVAFDAREAPELPEGWSRDFMIYTEGWLKDADLNTATGSRVEPLPYHGMARYPYGSEAAGYPDDSAHRAYLRTYNTRVREPGLAPLRADSTPPVGVSRR